MKKIFGYFTLGVMLLSCSLQAEQQASNIAVGSRILSEQERAELSLQREQAAMLEQNEAPVKKTASITKNFFERYYAAFHRPIAAAYNGSTLELSDGSVWTLKYFSDWAVVLSWLPRDSIVIEQNGYSSLEYTLTNQTTNQTVNASLTLGPLYQGNHTHWVVSKDTLWGTIQLEDGSKWEPYFSSDVKNWLPNDTVIMGVYDSFGSYNTIMINVNLLDCVRFKLKNNKN